MFGKLDFAYLLLALAVIGMLSFLIGNAINNILKQDAYGVIGNTLIMASGFIITVEYAPRFGLRVNALDEAVFAGLGGAFAILLVLSVGKMVSNRYL